jgi:hypothetical protein
MYWLELTVLAVIFLMDCVWILEFVIGFEIDSLALIPCAKGCSL